MGNSFGTPKSLAIAVLTFKRNEAIEALIPLLVEQLALVELPAKVIVVDNDPEAGAREIVSRFVDQDVLYAHEPEPGIAHARNRALSAAEDIDLLVFIDDDESPTAQWLPLMLAAYEKYQCVGVVGNVVRTFDVEPDAWIRAGRYFDKDVITTGTPQSAASTANLLLDMRFMREHDLRFDPVFGLSGGSDTLLTRQIVRSGGVLVWCAEALVVEQIPASRTSRKWVVTRHFRVGNSSSQTALAMTDSRVQRGEIRAKAMAAGAIRVLGGGARRLWGKATRSLEHDARGMRTVARGAGMFTGAVGYHYDREYRKLRSAEISAGQREAGSP